MDEFFALEPRNPWLPYVVIDEQIRSGWDDSVRSALCLNMARKGIAPSDILVAFVLLSGRWPKANPTAALNLLLLAHSVPTSPGPVGRFVSQAVIRCLVSGLSDSSAVVFEEALNVLGGLAEHHAALSASTDVDNVRKLAMALLAQFDDAELSQALRERIDQTFSGVVGASPIDAGAVRSFLDTLSPAWADLAGAIGDVAASTIRTHVIALGWANATERDSTGSSVQVVRIESTEGSEGDSSSAWGVIEKWIAVVKEFLNVDGSISFAPLDAAFGSLIVTFRIDADAALQNEIASHLTQAKAAPLTSRAGEALSDALRSRGLRVRVAHLESDRESASFSVEPTRGIARSTLRIEKLTTGDIPQANDWEKIFKVVDCVALGQPLTEETLGAVSRQIQYYRAAARVLGLLSTPSESLTRLGWLLHVAAGEERYKRASWAFETSPCGQAWIEWSSKKKLSEVPANSAKAFLAERSELTGDTIGRRASTLDQWLEKLRPYAD